MLLGRAWAARSSSALRREANKSKWQNGLLLLTSVHGVCAPMPSLPVHSVRRCCREAASVRLYAYSRFKSPSPLEVMAPKFSRHLKGQPMPKRTLQEMLEEARVRHGRIKGTNHMTTSGSLPTDSAEVISSRVAQVAACDQSQPPVSLPASSSTSSTRVQASEAVATTSSATAVTSAAPKRRKDIPIVKYAKRGNKATALEVASDPTKLQEAMEEYKQDVYSATDTSAYYVKTWFDVHDAVQWSAMGLDAHAERLPLTPTRGGPEEGDVQRAEEVHGRNQEPAHLRGLRMV